MIANPFKRYWPLVQGRESLRHVLASAQTSVDAIQTARANLVAAQAAANCLEAEDLAALEAVANLDQFQALVETATRMAGALAAAIDQSIVERGSWPDPDSDVRPGA